MTLYTRRELLGVETGLILAKQRLGPVSGIKVQPHTFGYVRAQLYGSAPSEVTWHRSEPQNSMDVYTDTIMNHKRRSFTHIWQQGKRFWKECVQSDGLTRSLLACGFDSGEILLLNKRSCSGCHRSTISKSNLKLFHSAQYTNYYLPNLIQVMVFPTERQLSDNRLLTEFPKKQARSLVLYKKNMIIL